MCAVKEQQGTIGQGKQPVHVASEQQPTTQKCAEARTHRNGKKPIHITVRSAAPRGCMMTCGRLVLKRCKSTEEDRLKFRRGWDTVILPFAKRKSRVWKLRVGQEQGRRHAVNPREPGLAWNASSA